MTPSPHTANGIKILIATGIFPAPKRTTPTPTASRGKLPNAISQSENHLNFSTVHATKWGTQIQTKMEEAKPLKMFQMNGSGPWVRRLKKAPGRNPAKRHANHTAGRAVAILNSPK